MSAALSLPPEPTNGPADLGFRGHVERKTQHGRFAVYCRRDGVWILYDPVLPFAARTVSKHETKDGACDAAERVSAAATARGEPNDVERKGDKWDWTQPSTWER